MKIDDNAGKAASVRRRKAVMPKHRKEFGSRRRSSLDASEETEIALLGREREEALEQQTVTAEILKVIASSPGDLTPVFDAMLENATRLCDASHCHVWRFDSGLLHAVAVRGDSWFAKWLREHSPVAPIPGSAADRIARGENVVQLTDRREEEAYASDPVFRDLVDTSGVRASLSVALRREGTLLGMINVYRKEVRPFSDRQVALLQYFAAQAVIAMENARLFNDTREALERQTATADILRVIASSPSDVQPVFEAIAQSAALLCQAEFCNVFRFDGELIHFMHSYGYSREAIEDLRHFYPMRPGRGSCAGRAILNGKVEQVPDVRSDPEYAQGNVPEIMKISSVLAVPMLKEHRPVGAIALIRAGKGNFPRRQIDLLKTFADQAIIAIENARLFGEVQARTRELAKSLDDLRTAQDRLIQTEKLASLGQLTAGIAHEIKNPLNFVNNFSSLSAELTDELNDVLKQERLTEKGREEVDELTRLLQDNLSKVVQHGRRADSIVKNMLLHSREGSGERRLSDVNALVRESLNLAYHGARAEKADFSITLKDDLDPGAGVLDLYPQEMTRALLNLISNGFYAATKRKAEAGHGTFEPVLSAATRNLGKTVEIRIRDNGAGIPLEVREKMFNPFFTTKPTGEGTGLGLSMTHDIIVKQHGGRIDVETRPGEFTEFTITLPRNNRRPSE